MHSSLGLCSQSKRSRLWCPVILPPTDPVASEYSPDRLRNHGDRQSVWWEVRHWYPGTATPREASAYDSELCSHPQIKLPPPAGHAPLPPAGQAPPQAGHAPPSQPWLLHEPLGTCPAAARLPAYTMDRLFWTVNGSPTVSVQTWPWASLEGSRGGQGTTSTLQKHLGEKKLDRGQSSSRLYGAPTLSWGCHDLNCSRAVGQPCRLWAPRFTSEGSDTQEHTQHCGAQWPRWGLSWVTRFCAGQ